MIFIFVLSCSPGSTCLSVGGGHTSNDYECGLYGLCQECVSDSMYIT